MLNTDVAGEILRIVFIRITHRFEREIMEENLVLNQEQVERILYQKWIDYERLN